MSTMNVVQPTTRPESAVTGATLSQQEALASLRILVCIAQSNGTIAPDERVALESALSELQLPSGVTIKSLLDEKVDFEAQMRLFTTPESRDLVYQSALGFAHSPQLEANKLLDRLRSGLQIGEDRASLAKRIIGEAKDTLLPSNIHASKDPALRASEVKADTVKYSVLSGVLASFPVPGVTIPTDLAVVAVQVKLVRRVDGSRRQALRHALDRPVRR